MRRITYIHQRPEWPAFHWDATLIGEQLAAVRYRQGRLLGRMEALGFRLRAEATLQTLTQDALKTSEIEGELLSHEQVRSSLAIRLGLETAGVVPVARKAEAIVKVVLDATQNFERLGRANTSAAARRDLNAYGSRLARRSYPGSDGRKAAATRKLCCLSHSILDGGNGFSTT